MPQTRAMRSVDLGGGSLRTPILCGTEPWRTVGDLELSHWDLWYLVVLVHDHGSDWDRLADAFRSGRRAQLSDRDDAEAKLSHLADLRRRLQRTALTPAALLEGIALDPALLRKTRRKVIELEIEERHKTDAMRDTPRRRLQARARDGCWDAFPVSPEDYARRFGWLSRRSFYGERAALALARRLEERLRALDRAGTPPAGPPRARTEGACTIRPPAAPLGPPPSRR